MWGNAGPQPPPGRPVRIALSGAAGGFGRTLLTRTVRSRRVRPTIACDVDIETLSRMLTELGLPRDEAVSCRNEADLTAAVAAGKIALVADAGLVHAAHYDVLVEATGQPAAGYALARAAIGQGRHVAMASKEVDAVAGVALAVAARDAGVVYTTVAGDQPGNLIDLVQWARRLELEIVGAGKSSEYDLVADLDTAQVSFGGRTVAADLRASWNLGDDVAPALTSRATALRELPRAATPDYCELAVVANATGLVPDRPDLHYPVARISELADIYALAEDGGLLGGTGRLDVFSHLRRPDEASFAGGVFVVVRCDDPVTWRMLAEKGHVVSRDHRYACIYRPYHLMGVETLSTVLDAAELGRGAGDPATSLVAAMTAVTARDLPAGHGLRARGHHHDIDGLTPALTVARETVAAGNSPGNPADDAEPAAPYYLAAGTSAAADLPAGRLLRASDLNGVDPALLEAWNAGLTTSPDAATTGAPR